MLETLDENQLKNHIRKTQQRYNWAAWLSGNAVNKTQHRDSVTDPAKQQTLTKITWKKLIVQSTPKPKNGKAIISNITKSFEIAKVQAQTLDTKT